MRSVILIELLFAALACRCVGAEANIKTSFEAHAVLSPSELRTVAALANQCGVSEVAEVYTYNIHPSSAFGIGVKGIERIEGRKISFVTVMVDSEKWVRKPKGEPPDIFKAKGKFWVRRGGVLTNELTTFTVQGTTLRLQLGKEVSIATADQIVAALAANRIQFTNEKLREKLKGIDLTQPHGLSEDRTKNTFTIMFSPDRLTMYLVDCTFDGETITVTKVGMLVS